jgi:hypothetical protein
MTAARIAFVASMLTALTTIPAQTVIPLPTRGISPAFEFGLTFDNDLSVIARKRTNLPAKLETFAGTSGPRVPPYLTASIAACIPASVGVTSQMLQIDAMSTANDLLPIVFANNRFQIGVANVSTGWAVLYYSQLAPPFPGYAETGANIMGYYFDNPSFPQQLRHGIYHEVLRSDFQGLTVPTPTTANIGAMDFAMGLIVTNRGQRDPGIITNLTDLYFSLTNATIQSNPQLRAAFPGHTIDGATIFVARFESTTGTWGTLEVHRSGIQLGLPAGTEIDALAMFRAGAPASVPAGSTGLEPQSMCYIISAEYGQLEAEVMVAATPDFNPALPDSQLLRPLRRPNGDPIPPPVSGPNGPLPGRVKSLCGQDPESSEGCMSFGEPTHDSLALPTRMGLSLTAYDEVVGTSTKDDFKLFGVLSGWGLAPRAEEVVLAIEYPAGNFWFQYLPNRAASEDSYSFEVSVVRPWSAGDINQYKFLVATMPLPGSSSGPDISVSFTSRFRRWMNP